jgi:hypothetical protein
VHGSTPGGVSVWCLVLWSKVGGSLVSSLSFQSSVSYAPLGPLAPHTTGLQCTTFETHATRWLHQLLVAQIAYCTGWLTCLHDGEAFSVTDSVTEAPGVPGRVCKQCAAQGLPVLVTVTCHLTHLPCPGSCTGMCTQCRLCIEKAS